MSRRRMSRWRMCRVIGADCVSAWHSGLSSTSRCPLPLPPCWQHPWRLRRKDPCRLIWRLREQAKGNCKAALRPRTLHLVGGEAVTAGDVVAGDAYHQAPAARLGPAKLKKLLQHHTCCHHQWTRRHDSESLQAEIAAA